MPTHPVEMLSFLPSLFAQKNPSCSSKRCPESGKVAFSGSFTHAGTLMNTTLKAGPLDVEYGKSVACLLQLMNDSRWPFLLFNNSERPML